MSEKTQKHIITALVTNKSGVLTRISGLFARRGYNIDSLSVCNTNNPELSRMTIVALGTDDEINQIVRQLDKLWDCHKIRILKPSECVKRELLLIKVKVPASRRPEIESTANMMKVKIIDVGASSVTCEMTGEPNKIDKFIELMQPYGILELARTGITALSRGEDVLDDLPDYNVEISG
ncbi:MAG TPA: acetolactate synthase small subunit [Candidatus Protoclostridium stercorigallinarum]|uniref:Acetolactate synthase small subunit n=1 Tax=Candidatus Protoclostridium stercorigallinarum TaxID=2838741 RepID=A0A9D1Q098_9FIRM|nr:acetolactate synthase small subunit [Candidatus Protoclostridium stercorigallinarum]